MKCYMIGFNIKKIILMKYFREPQVIINCICALNEIDNKVNLNKNLINYLINKFQGFEIYIILKIVIISIDFNEWGKCMVLELISQYKISDENEMFNIFVTFFYYY